MGIKRDFTQSKIDELNKIIDYYENDGQWGACDWFGDLIADELNVSNYMNELEKYHDHVIDKHNIYKEDFQKIINDVEAFDGEFESKLSMHRGFKETVGSKLKQLAEAMNPTMITMGNIEFNKHISKVEVNDRLASAFGLTKEEYDKIVNTMIEQYGFTEQEIFMILKAQYLHSIYYISERDKQYLEALGTDRRLSEDEFLLNSEAHSFFRYMAGLCINYSGERHAWKLTGNLPTTEEASAYLKKIGFTKAQADMIFNSINKQHEASTDKNQKDFAHEMVALTIFTNENWTKDIMNFICQGQINELSSHKGDIYSGRFGIDDMLSDTDVVNVYNRIKKDEDNYWGIFIEYNNQVSSGETNRAEEFLQNYGDGTIENGRNQFIDDMKSWSVGSDYIGEIDLTSYVVYDDNDELDRMKLAVKVNSNLELYLEFLEKELSK